MTYDHDHDHDEPDYFDEQDYLEDDEQDEQDEPDPFFGRDGLADADALSSAGHGTDEDYGDYGTDEDYGYGGWQRKKEATGQKTRRFFFLYWSRSIVPVKRTECPISNLES
jgi:hypothetical protein